MGRARLCVRKQRAVVAARGPQADGGVGGIGVKWPRVGASLSAGWHWKATARRQQVASGRKVKALTVPLIDLLGPWVADCKSALSRADRIVTYLRMSIRVRIDAAAEMTREHLGAKANAEERFALFERHRNPIDLAAHEIIFVIGAHRAAEDDRARMLGHARRQRVAIARAANVERKAALHQSVPDPAGRGALLMQHNKNRQSHGVRIRWHAGDALEISRAPVSLASASARGRHEAGAGLYSLRPMLCRFIAQRTRPRGPIGASIVARRLRKPGTIRRCPACRPR